MTAPAFIYTSEPWAARSFGRPIFRPSYIIAVAVWFSIMFAADSPDTWLGIAEELPGLCGVLRD
jgi:hypothetical protein